MAEGDLGALMPLGGPAEPGGSGGAQPQQSPGTWSGLVQDPVTRAAMISFGLQLMTGGHGNALQQVGVAGGHAAQAAGNTAGAMQEEARNQRDFAAKEREGFENRASHEKIADITSEGRIAARQVAADASIERAKIGLQKAGSNVSAKYLSEARKIVENSIANINLDDMTKTRMIQDKAAQLYDADAQRGLVPPTTSQPGAPAVPSAGSPRGSPTPAQAGTQTQGASTSLIDKAISDPVHGPKFKSLLSTPEGRQELYKNRSLGRDVKAEIAKMYPGETDFEKMNKAFEALGDVR